MGTQSQYSLYVLCIIIGCVVATFVGYSMHYLATNGFEDDQTEREMSQEQRDYMRNVRYRNFLALEQQSRSKGYAGGPRPPSS